MVPETKLETTDHGLAPKGDGWFVLNMRDAEWRHADGRGAVCVVADDFEGWRRESNQCPQSTKHVIVGAGSVPAS